jgi:nicotinate-nucleotide pyrophosphorylase (carboxylating)
MNGLVLEELIKRCLSEDIGNGDVTTESIVPREAVTSAVIHAKQPGVVAGIFVAAAVFAQLHPEIQFVAKVCDGDKVAKGTVLAEIHGPAREILTGERLALNFLQRLSGIATVTAKLVNKTAGYPVRVVDTRKTTPGLRMLEKYAVTAGGGYNHRTGLYDGVLIKDNHIKVAGGIAQAIAAARKHAPHMVKIEVEVEDMEGVKAALAAKADVIMLDNMGVEAMRRAVEFIAGKALVEASGGVDEQTIAAIAATGVDLISVGALTHSAPALDISLDIGEIKVKNAG